MNELVQATFDYDAFSSETKSFLEERAQSIHARLKRAAEDIVSIGYDLKASQQHLIERYGVSKHFLAWIDAEFGMSQRTAYNFISVAERFGENLANFARFSASVLYELAAPSTSQEIVDGVQSGQIEPNLAAIKEAKEAQKQAEEEVKRAHEQLWQTQEISQNRSIQLNEQLTKLRLELELLTAKKASGISPEAQEKINKLIEQRNNLSEKVKELGEEARQAALKRNEEEQERRIRQEWRKLTKDFQVAVVKMLTQLPTAIDVQVFESDDWERLSQSKELARRFIAECDNLSRSPSMIIDAGWEVPYAVES